MAKRAVYNQAFSLRLINCDRKKFMWIFNDTENRALQNTELGMR